MIPIGVVSLLLLIGAGLNSCVSSWFGFAGGHDSRTIILQTVGLFNQRDDGKAKDKSWRGDWIFRRERLALLDNELRNSKPDILIIQEMMRRRGSPSESDEAILLAGSLAGYDFDHVDVNSFDDTREVQAMGVAIGLPLKVTFSRVPDKRRFWMLGNDGFMVVTLARLENQTIPIFNVQMPMNSDGGYLWYKYMQDQILEYMKDSHLCSKRMIVAGYMPVKMDASKFQDFVERLQLKDVAEGQCKVSSNCNTISSINELYLSTMKKDEPGRVDRILVNTDTIVYSSGKAFQNSEPASRYAKAFGFNRLWPVRRFGWGATIRLPRCSQDELD